MLPNMKNLEHHSLTLDHFEISVKWPGQLRAGLIPAIQERVVRLQAIDRSGVC
jgi:hypothetical protein